MSILRKDVAHFIFIALVFILVGFGTGVLITSRQSSFKAEEYKRDYDQATREIETLTRIGREQAETISELEGTVRGIREAERARSVRTGELIAGIEATAGEFTGEFAEFADLLYELRDGLLGLGIITE